MSSVRHMINAAAAVSVALSCAATPAFASGEIICEATDGSGASILIGVGRLPVLHVLSATATDGERTWSTNPTGDDLAFIFGQGYSDDRQILVDFTDPNVEGIVVSLRLFQASAEAAYAQAGVLHFTGTVAFPVQCING